MADAIAFLNLVITSSVMMPRSMNCPTTGRIR
jgi:hypothetical protein